MTELYNIVSGMQNEKRYNHTLGVIEMAVKLSKQYALSSEKCELAALLHDVTKQLDCDLQAELLAVVDDSQIIANRALWHSYTGAIYAEQVLGVSDRDVLEAIKYHTTGKLGCSDLAQVIYISDYLELGRSYQSVIDLRRYIGHVSLGELYRLVARTRIEYEISQGHSLHDDTKELYESII